MTRRIEDIVADQADPKPYACEDYGKRWCMPSAAEDCCGDWLGYD